MRPASTAVTEAPLLEGEEAAWALASSASSDGLWYFDVLRDEVRISPRAMELLGYQADDAPPPRPEVGNHVHPHDLPILQRAVGQIIRGNRTRIELELRLISAAGATRWALIRARSARDADGQVSIIAGSLTDIDARKRMELQLREESRRDALTGLPNRTVLNERLIARIARAARKPSPRFALLYADLDRFKFVNDSLGHAAGDALLLATARRLAGALGPDDLLVRLGGDEFVVLLDAVGDVEDARRVADTMQHAMREPVDVHMAGREVFVGLSVGVRISEVTGNKPSDLLRDADVAMYQAKREGGARTIVFDQAMYAAMVERLHVQTALHHALQRAEFRLAYQPIFQLSDRRLSGFEVLARWQHPTRGRLSAADFVNDANESGIIIELGRWVLNEACAQLADWRRTYPNALPLTVSVNLCDREVLNPEFGDMVESALVTHGIPASCLVLEMTEGVMAASSERGIPALRRLRELGVQIQLDNFGRGFSSIIALRQMPITAIKVDRSFIASMTQDAESRAIIQTITAFARALGLEVVAEGVETTEQADALAELGEFRYVQGHLYGRPSGEAKAKGMIAVS